jgi:hypothetical protein
MDLRERRAALSFYASRLQDFSVERIQPFFFVIRLAVGVIMAELILLL